MFTAIAKHIIKSNRNTIIKIENINESNNSIK